MGRVQYRKQVDGGKEDLADAKYVLGYVCNVLRWNEFTERQVMGSADAIMLS